MILPPAFWGRALRRSILCGALPLAVGFSSLTAATLTWDPGFTPATGSDGSGTWDNATAIFTNGASDQVYASTQAALTTAATASGTNTITVAAAQAGSLAVGDAFNSATFPTGTVISSINTATGVLTLSANSIATLASGSTLIFAPNTDVRFGALATGTGGVVTLSTGVTQSANNLTLGAQVAGSTYTFNAGTISLGTNSGTSGTLTVNNSATINSALQLSQLSFGVTGQTLTLTGGATRFTTGNGNGGISGTSGAIGAASTLVFSAPAGGTAAYNTAANDLYNIGNPNIGGTASAGMVVANGATFQTANAAGTPGTNNIFIGYGANGVVTVQSGGTWSQNSPSTGLGALVIARNNTGRFIVQTGGTLINTGTAAATGISIGMTGGIGELDVAGGTATTNFLGLNVGSTAANAAGTLAVSSGTMSIGTINFGTGYSTASSAGTGTIAVSGGALYVGAGGIVQTGTGTYTSVINLSGGAVGATAAWTTTLPMSLTNGTTTFQTSNAGLSGVTTATANNITLSAVLSGNGSLVTTGGGVLTLAAANTYAGTTVVNGGTLLLSTGSIAGPTLTVNNTGTLTLQNATSLADTMTLRLLSGSTFNLNQTGAETINQLFLDGNPVAANTYSATQLAAMDANVTFAGSGTLTVLMTGAIPEPSTWVAALLGAGALGMTQRRRFNCG